MSEQQPETEFVTVAWERPLSAQVADRDETVRLEKPRQEPTESVDEQTLSARGLHTHVVLRHVTEQE